MPPLPHAQSAESFKRHDAASYDDVADSFESYTERFTAPIAARLVEMAHLAPQARVLDVGCGTGIVSRIAARNMGAAGRVVGVDLSDGMLGKAATLATAESVGQRIDFCKGDAERLEFADASFDAVVSLYALRHFPNPSQALREMIRVGRPGSRAVIGIGSGAPLFSRGFLLGAARAALERTQALVGRAPLHATVFLDRLVARHGGADTHHHGTADAVGDLAAAMRTAGYTDVQSHWVGQTSQIGSVDDFWGIQVTLSTRARKALPTMDERRLAALRGEFDQLCGAHLARGGRLLYRSGALIAVGTRPG